MECCSKCGRSFLDDAIWPTLSGLDFLEDIADLVDRRPAEKTLCERCREERRLLGAALLDDTDSFVD